MAYFRIEPFGPLQESQRAGMIAATIANTTPGIKRHFDPVDFFAELDVAGPDFDENEDPEDRAAAARDGRFFNAVMANLKQRKAAEAADGD